MTVPHYQIVSLHNLCWKTHLSNHYQTARLFCSLSSESISLNNHVPLTGRLFPEFLDTSNYVLVKAHIFPSPPISLLPTIVTETGQVLLTLGNLSLAILSLLVIVLFLFNPGKQTVVFRSYTKAEYRSLADSTCELTWLTWLLKDLKVIVHIPS